jgi:hypothetical protein
MSSVSEDYSAPTVSEYDLDPGGNYAPSKELNGSSAPGVLTSSVDES